MTSELSQTIQWKGGGWFPEGGKTYYVLMTNGHIYTVKVTLSNKGYTNPEIPGMEQKPMIEIDSVAHLKLLDGVSIKFWAEASEIPA